MSIDELYKTFQAHPFWIAHVVAIISFTLFFLLMYFSTRSGNRKHQKFLEEQRAKRGQILAEELGILL